jgi:hypothetical protein
MNNDCTAPLHNKWIRDLVSGGELALVKDLVSGL